jgi:hypothetical protein
MDQAHDKSSGKVDVTTAAHLLRFLWPEFTEIRGMYFLKSFAPTSARVGELLKEFNGNRTEVEAFCNHHHMADIFQHRFGLEKPTQDVFWDDSHPDFRRACEVARAMAQMWYHKLKTEFPSRRFRVYYTQQDNPIVRFHMVRPEEAVWTRESDNSDAIAGEILIYDTITRPSRSAKSKRSSTTVRV